MSNLSKSAPQRNRLSSDNLSTALELAVRGMAVFPVAVREQEEGTLEKKPTVRWRIAASILPSQIREWWAAQPSCVVGIDLDRAGLCVIDLDRHPGAPDGIAAFRSLRGNNPVPVVPVTITATGGRHLFFRNMAGLTNARGNLPAGIDVRGVGGFVVAPGSAWESYAWQSHPKFPRLVDVYPDDIPSLPDWLLRVVRPPRQPTSTERASISTTFKNDRSIVGIIKTIASAHQGERNATTFWGACRLAELVRDGKLAAGDAIGLVIEAASRTGLSHNEAQQTARSALRTMGI